MVHHVGVVETLIAEMRKSVDGELSGRSQVVDHLLDLRLAVQNRDSVLAVVDGLLADVPGRSTVPNGWWLAGLADVERAWRRLPVPAGAAIDGDGGGADRPPLPRRVRPDRR